MELLLCVTLFVAVAGLFVGMNLLLGRLVRPRLPHPIKGEAYECGEAPFGPAWVQFDLRFYIVALVYLVFAVEVALFYPWAVVYGDAERIADALARTAYDVRLAALVDMLFFFGVLLVGFAYLWRFGYLDWVKTESQSSAAATVTPAGVATDGDPTDGDPIDGDEFTPRHAALADVAGVGDVGTVARLTDARTTDARFTDARFTEAREVADSRSEAARRATDTPAVAPGVVLPQELSASTKH